MGPRSIRSSSRQPLAPDPPLCLFRKVGCAPDGAPKLPRHFLVVRSGLGHAQTDAWSTRHALKWVGHGSSWVQLKPANAQKEPNNNINRHKEYHPTTATCQQDKQWSESSCIILHPSRLQGLHVCNSKGEAKEVTIVLARTAASRSDHSKV